MRILLLEDEEGVSTLLTACLQRWNWDIVQAHDGQEAWNRLESDAFDLLITDWRVPILSGTDLVKKVREDKKYKQLPILMISGHAGRLDVVDAVRAGIDGFLSKPFSPDQLKSQIDAIARGREKPAAEQLINRLYHGYLAFDKTATNPLVLFGVSTNTLEGLSRPNAKNLVAYLVRATSAIARVNAECPGLKIGYLLESSTQDIVLRLKKQTMRDRVKLMLVSMDCEGNILHMLRSLRANKKADLATFLVCGDAREFSIEQRAELSLLQVGVVDRRQLEDIEHLNTLIKEHVAAKSAAASQEKELPLADQGLLSPLQPRAPTPKTIEQKIIPRSAGE